MKLVAWLGGGPEIEQAGDEWVTVNISEDDAITLLSAAMCVYLLGGTFLPVEVDE